MLPQKPERLESVEEPKRQELVTACYDLVGCLHEVPKLNASITLLANYTFSKVC